jgi:hypothetical protein
MPYQKRSLIYSIVSPGRCGAVPFSGAIAFPSDLRLRFLGLAFLVWVSGGLPQKIANVAQIEFDAPERINEPQQQKNLEQNQD